MKKITKIKYRVGKRPPQPQLLFMSQESHTYSDTTIKNNFCLFMFFVTVFFVIIAESYCEAHDVIGIDPSYFIQIKFFCLFNFF